MLWAGSELSRADDASTPAQDSSQQAATSVPVFERDVFPLLKTYCWRCHGGEGREAGLDMRSFALLSKGGAKGPVIVPGSADKSLLYQKIAAGEMPPGAFLKPTDAHRELIRAWLDGGARADKPAEAISTEEDPPITPVDRDWWAFKKPVRPHIPQVASAHLVRTPIDAFILARLEEQGLSLSPEADRRTLIRRAYFDLIGLPSEPEQIDAFANDPCPDAFEQVVDALLANPAYGERWGRHWLDAAGYVDTIGSDNDASIIEPREAVWKYRDYVVNSFNADKPYDRFLLEQIAGDELVDWRNAPTFTPEIEELLVATGFLRQAADVTYAPELNTADIRHQVVYDTVQIFSANVLGLTVHCAQCHTHKFDPIPQADYYRLAALFTPGYNVQQWLHSRGRHLPDVSPAEKKRIDAHNAHVDGQIAQIKQQIADVRRSFEERLLDGKLASLPEAIRADVKGSLAAPAEKRTDVQKYLADKLGPMLQVKPEEVDKALDETARRRSAELHSQIAAVEKTKRTHGVIQAFWDVAAPPPAFLYHRGDYQHPGGAIRPGVIGVLDDPDHPFVLPTPQAGAPTSGYRTALARWLVRPDHPLTARVFVNRVWQHYFGKGLVETPDNFGASGMMPSHPELLDWLAVEFVESGWDVKHLHRLIVTSAVYRQASSSGVEESALRAKGASVDPENTLLWRMPLRRLESEIVRDRMLGAGGELIRTLGGAPLPLKPNADGSVEIDCGKLPSACDALRRSLYIFARRNYQLTELSVFDQPQVAHNCTHRRHSAVVLQSLTLLNGTFTVERARACAARASEAAGNDSAACIIAVFRTVLGRNPSDAEAALAGKLLETQQARHREEQKLTDAAAADAALADVCHMLLNSNEFLYVE